MFSSQVELNFRYLLSLHVPLHVLWTVDEFLIGMPFYPCPGRAYSLEALIWDVSFQHLKVM